MVVRLFSRKMQKAVVAAVSQPFETVEKRVLATTRKA